MRATDSAIAEHLPLSVLDSLWPERRQHLESTSVIRDGRVLSERTTADCVFDDAIEVVKRPRSVLFRGDEQEPAPPQAGDAVCLPHGPVLLQTMSTGARNHVHAIQITVANRPLVPPTVVGDILALSRTPGRDV